MEKDTITLCSPDDRKTCFGCCPPIRPPGYEHVQYRGMVQRMLRENTRTFDKAGRDVVPITGFSCWALGYLDPDYRRIGCLLHPARNGGRDLRYRVDYGEKCRRETCPEAKTFSLLDEREKSFWMNLADDLDSFSFSSRKRNPLFTLLGWGPRLLQWIAGKERGKHFTADLFFKTYPFFKTTLSPRANAYLLYRGMTPDTLHLLKEPGFRMEFEDFSGNVAAALAGGAPETPEGIPIFRLSMDEHFRDLLRLFLRRSRIPVEAALCLKADVDRMVQSFFSSR
ncbi:MAG: hypothetical protein JRH13_05355 [Deltaproteobacteria bacterium]|nr:hypothetical protein [Deltaproteobacteria bacterium]MBW2303803.1 hypothetical protein [Deltaproteobacteria bacterium]